MQSSPGPLGTTSRLWDHTAYAGTTPKLPCPRAAARARMRQGWPGVNRNLMPAPRRHPSSEPGAPLEQRLSAATLWLPPRPLRKLA